MRIVSAVELAAVPAGTVVAVKDIVALGGRFVAEKVAADESVPPCTAKTIGKLALFPAVTVVG